MKMPDVRLYLLGTLHLTIDGRLVVMDSPSISLLLAYLALNAAGGHLVSRLKVASAFWPDLEEARARRQLNDLVHRLRKKLDACDPQLADALLYIEANSLALESIWIDVAEFRTGARGVHLADWRASLDLYAGDLLEDMDAEWLLGPRLSLHELYVATLARACRALADQGNFEEALRYARRWSEGDPFNEDARRASMQLLARLGQRAAALRQYDLLVRLLHTEIQAEPLPETQALADTLRAETEALPRGATQTRRLVGRRHERALLIELAERAQEGHGGVVLVEGEPGIGKTRLLEALSESATWRGMRVVWGSANAAAPNDVSSCVPLDVALRAALWGSYGEHVRERLAPSARKQLERLVAGNARTYGDECVASQNLELGQVTAAISEAVKLLAEATPHVIVLDVLQDVQPPFWQVIRNLAAQLDAQRCLLVLSYRDDVLHDARARRALQQIERSSNAVLLSLGCLTPDECGELARSLGVWLTPEMALRLHRRAGGNPLYIQELLRDDAAAHASSQVAPLLAKQADRLPTAARVALEVAAVLGETWGVSIWRVLAGDDVHTVAPLLVEWRILEEVSEDYRFRQGLLREHLYATLGDERRRSLHGHVAEALRAQGAAPALLASHYERAGQRREASKLYGIAAEQAAQEGRSIEAVSFYDRALALLELVRGGARDRTLLEAARKHLLRRTGSRPAAAPLVVKLARLDAPQGKRLADDERVAVSWTIDAGEADDAVARTAGKKALRRRRILRLLAEAAEQGAAATDRDLAQALGVTERTIESDIAALRASGRNLVSRGRPK